MTATIDPPRQSTAAADTGKWIHDWRPEDPEFWESKGKKIARRNLIFSILSEHIGFSVWVLWSVFVLFLPGGQYGISTDAIEAAGQKFLLTSLPAALGSFVRIPYTLAVARFGGRNWTIVSALTLLIPTVASAFLLKPESSLATLLFLAAITGFGGGNFASSMTNINAFYPTRLKGWALGLNAGGGNLGVASVQAIGLVVLVTAGIAHPRYILFIYIPAIVLAALGAYLFMDNIADLKNDKGAMRDVIKDKHTWYMSFLYIGTFGSFIGFGFAFGQVLTTQFGADFSGKVNKLSGVSATRTPISDWLKNTTWFKDQNGKKYYVTGELDAAGKPVAGFKPHAIDIASIDLASCTFAAEAKPAFFHLTADQSAAFKAGTTDPSLAKPVLVPGTTEQVQAKAYSCADPATAGNRVVLLTGKLDKTASYMPIKEKGDAWKAVKAAPIKVGHQPDPVKVAWWVFLGPLIGSLIRPVGGRLADKFGGARTTFLNFIAMAAAATLVLVASLSSSLPLFIIGFVALFILAGLGNGSTYKMIPAIFRAKHGDTPAARRLSGALIGIAGAVGAFGGVLVNVAFRQSFLNYKNGNGAYIAFIVFYVLCIALTWAMYLRKSPKRLEGV
jgi:nitrate/nitrite transporter NarK